MPAQDKKKPPPCAVINPISGVQRPMLPTIRNALTDCDRTPTVVWSAVASYCVRNAYFEWSTSKACFYFKM